MDNDGMCNVLMAPESNAHSTGIGDPSDELSLVEHEYI